MVIYASQLELDATAKRAADSVKQQHWSRPTAERQAAWAGQSG